MPGCSHEAKFHFTATASWIFKFYLSYSTYKVIVYRSSFFSPQTPLEFPFFHCLNLFHYLEGKRMSLFFLSKHIDFKKISFCSFPQAIELSAKHRSRSKAQLSTTWSLKDLTIVLDWRLPRARVPCHHLLWASQRIVELCFPHNTHSFWT